MPIDDVIVAAIVAAIVTIALNTVNNRTEGRRRRRDRQRSVEIEAIAHTRAFVSGTLMWLSISRDHAGPAAAGEFPDALSYPRHKLSVIGDGQLIANYRDATLEYTRLPESGGLTVQQKAKIVGVMGSINRALDAQEARALADKPLLKVTPEWEKRLNDGMNEYVFALADATDEIRRRHHGSG